MLRVLQIRLREQHNAHELEGAIAKRLRIKRAAIKSYKIYKRSVDARKKKIVLVYAVDVDVEQETEVLRGVKESNVFRVRQEPVQKRVVSSVSHFSHPPVVIGSGPAGLFAALTLVEAGLQPVVFERGEDVDARIKTVRRFTETGAFSPTSNISFGEGGAGTFSDGKLYTTVNNERVRGVLEELVACGAPEEILSQGKPHVGTDKLCGVVKALREKIVRGGGTVKFNSTVTGLQVEQGSVTGVVVNSEQIVRTDHVFLAIGASARDTYEMLYEQGVTFTQKPFSIGVRIEHPQSVINKAQYGTVDPHPRLGPAEYKLVHHCTQSRRTVYTFCMCPGGYVVPAASESGGVVTNGMSTFSRDAYNANSAVVVGIDPADFEDSHPLAGIAFQRQWERAAYRLGGENYVAPIQLVGDFLAGRRTTALGIVEPTYRPGVFMSDMHECLPDYVCDALKEAIREFDKKVTGFASHDAVLTGVETRTSAPVRISRSEAGESSLRGLYPVGEGAGYAGGIVSAAIDGMGVAEKVCTMTE